jgi:hypothetical protein
MFTLIFIFFRGSSNLLKKFILTLVLIIIVFYIGTLIFSRALWPHYLIGLPVVYIFLFSLGLYLLGKKFKNNVIGITVLFFCIILNFKNLSSVTNFKSPSWEGDASVYRNQLEVIDYVYREANDQEFKYVVYTPPVFDYTYRYLFMWYGPSKYKKYPNESAKTAFFIIEPDPGYPDRPRWWLEAREKDGKIVKQEKLKGGIVVQTRKVE